MTRTSFVTGIVALLLATALPVWAGPDVSPPESVDFDDVLEDTWCGFEVEVHLEGKSGFIGFDDRAVLTAPVMKAQLTNGDTGKTVSLKIPGSFHDTLLDDDNVRTVNLGRNLLFGYFDFDADPDVMGEPGLFLTIGKVVTDWKLSDLDLGLNIFDVIESESPGKMIDVCAQLEG